MKVNPGLTVLFEHCMTLVWMYCPVQKEHQFQQQKLYNFKNDLEEIWR